MKTTFVITTLIIALSLYGCANEDQEAMMTGNTISQITITPNDGATDVRLDALVTLSFAKPVDRSITERNLHLLSQKDMADSSCSMGMIRMSIGMMDSAMMDSSKMNHLAGQHGTNGRFQWNNASTLCSFVPDSLMMPNMSYMIHIGREMTQMMETRMGSMAMMGSHGVGMMSGDMMYHFQTMDTTAAESGHDGHH